MVEGKIDRLVLVVLIAVKFLWQYLPLSAVYFVSFAAARCENKILTRREHWRSRDVILSCCKTLLGSEL